MFYLKKYTTHEIDNKKKILPGPLKSYNFHIVTSEDIDNYFPTFSLLCQFVQTVSLICLYITKRKCQGPLIDEDVNFNRSG